MTILLVALGGALGAVLRYASVALAGRWLGAGFPYGVMGVNVLGSLLMGLCAVWLTERSAHPSAPFLMTGVLGGFTTFSAFSLDTLRLVEGGRIAAAGAYVGGSVILSLAALALGLMIARSL